jgi:hypothetical protein
LSTPRARHRKPSRPAARPGPSTTLTRPAARSALSSPATRPAARPGPPAVPSRSAVPSGRARHRKPPQTVSSVPPPAAVSPAAPPTAATPARGAAPRRHRKPSALQGRPAKATAVTALAVTAAAASGVVTHWSFGTSGHPAAARASAASAHPGAAGRRPAGAGLPGPSAATLTAQQPAILFHPDFTLNTASHPRPKGRHHRPVSAVAAAPSGTPLPASGSPYSNPLRAVTDLIPERVDMGVDFGGSGPVYPIGDAVITNATGDSSGWPGGGWITYRLTDGPDAGLVVYVAEDVQPAVAVGESVTPSTVIANMYNGADGIETGWAMPDGASSESEMPEAGGIGGGGPFPTMVGLSFENLLRSLGVPASSDAGSSGYGVLPPGYPAA